MELQDLYREFQGLMTASEKVSYLEEMSRLNLPYYINWQGLIDAWKAVAAGV